MLIHGQGGRAIQEHFQNNLREALQDAFPELDFSGVDIKQRGKKNYWKDVSNCRKFFVDFAKEAGLDPLHEATWHSVAFKDLESQSVRICVASDDSYTLLKGGHTIPKKYGGWARALQAAFPELNLDFQRETAQLRA